MIDVENLRRPHRDGEPVTTEAHTDGWNNCIDYLASRNLLGGVPQWQPIETAPKDKNILLTNGKNVTFGLYNGDVFAKNPKSYFQIIGFRVVDSRNYRPTHYMPLPAAPSSEKVGG